MDLARGRSVHALDRVRADVVVIPQPAAPPPVGRPASGAARQVSSRDHGHGRQPDDREPEREPRQHGDRTRWDRGKRIDVRGHDRCSDEPRARADHERRDQHDRQLEDQRPAHRPRRRAHPFGERGRHDARTLTSLHVDDRDDQHQDQRDHPEQVEDQERVDRGLDERDVRDLIRGDRQIGLHARVRRGGHRGIGRPADPHLPGRLDDVQRVRRCPRTRRIRRASATMNTGRSDDVPGTVSASATISIGTSSCWISSVDRERPVSRWPSPPAAGHRTRR